MARRADKAKLGLTGVSDDKIQLTPQQILIQDYQSTFSNGPGERVLKDLRSRFQNRNSFVPDSNVTAFHEGQRDVVRMIELLLDADPLVAITINAEEQS